MKIQLNEIDPLKTDNAFIKKTKQIARQLGALLTYGDLIKEVNPKWFYFFKQ